MDHSFSRIFKNNLTLKVIHIDIINKSSLKKIKKERKNFELSPKNIENFICQCFGLSQIAMQ